MQIPYQNPSWYSLFQHLWSPDSLTALPNILPPKSTWQVKSGFFYRRYFNILWHHHTHAWILIYPNFSMVMSHRDIDWSWQQLSIENSNNFPYGNTKPPHKDASLIDASIAFSQSIWRWLTGFYLQPSNCHMHRLSKWLYSTPGILSGTNLLTPSCQLNSKCPHTITAPLLWSF